MSHPVPFAMPPATRTSEGRPRRVGFELEFAGVDAAEAAAMLVELFGGRAVEESRFVHRVEETGLGEFGVELDATMLKDRAYVGFLEKLGVDIDASSLGDRIDDWLARVATNLVPLEIVTPPLPLESLEETDRIRHALSDLRARGTGSRLVYAFGLHINPEIPSADAPTVLALLRAYLLLHDWLVARSGTDLSRRVTPFVNRFPDAYVVTVLDPDYAPDEARLIDDYLDENPTRNRALDLLPVLAWMDGDRVAERAEEPHLVRARPALHYRLPDCRVDDPDWSVAAEWNRWVEVERLAARPDALEEASRTYLGERTLLDRLDRARWADRVEAWLG